MADGSVEALSRGPFPPPPTPCLSIWVFQLVTYVLWLIIFLVFFNRFTDTEIDEMLHGAPVDSKGLFDYVKFTKIIKHGKDDDWRGILWTFGRTKKLSFIFLYSVGLLKVFFAFLYEKEEDLFNHSDHIICLTS